MGFYCGWCRLGKWGNGDAMKWACDRMAQAKPSDTADLRQGNLAKTAVELGRRLSELFRRRRWLPQKTAISL